MTTLASQQAQARTTKVKTLIIGAGFSGLCMAIKLKAAGLTDFVVLEKAGSLGGTWRENTYPGAECDIPSVLYSYSFEHNTDWEFKWSGQAQILKYQNDTAVKYGLLEFIKFEQTVCQLLFDEKHNHWLVTTASGLQYQAQHVVSAVGQLHYPSTPFIDKADQFNGHCFHSAEWDHELDLSGKRVAVIGNAASAVQFIPEIARQVSQLTIFQRSANWMLPKIDRPYANWERKLSTRLPVLTKAYRHLLWALGEYILFPGIKGNRLVSWAIRRVCLLHLHWRIKDPSLRAKLTPNYAIGAKRVLFCDHYYPALARDNVELIGESIQSFCERGLCTVDGIERDFDVVIYGTGFKTNPFFEHITIQGIGGRNIREAWQEGAQAYLGVTTHGFPNLHMLYGPNTNLGHTSVIIMFEAQADYVVSAINYLDQSNAGALDVKADVEHQFNVELQQRLAKLAFTKVEHSWYMDSNKITNNWVGGTREYVRRLANINWSDYTIID